MRKYCILIIFLVFFLLYAGCSKNGTDRENSREDPFDSGLIITTNLPESLSELHCYTLEYYTVDEERAISTLMSHEPDQKEERALGPCYIYGLEYLQLCYKVVMGGLQYVKYKEGPDSEAEGIAAGLKNTVTAKGFPDTDQEVAKDYLIPFSTDRDIGSITREDVQRQMALLWEQMEFPDLEMRACYTRDQETMNRNLEEFIVYTKKNSNPDYQADYKFTDEDEDYLMYYRQLIDGIPLASQQWQKQNGEGTATTFTAEYSPLYGLTYLQVSNLYNIKETLPVVEIVSPEKAIERYREEYDKAFHFGTTEISDIELCYIVVRDKGVLTARPAWILTARTAAETKTASGEDTVLYELTTVDAQTLEIVKTADVRD